MARAMLAGIAKPMPLPAVVTAVLMPMTSPRTENSGPPELPGFIGASVWMKSKNPWLLPGWTSRRPLAETTPMVTE